MFNHSRKSVYESMSKLQCSFVRELAKPLIEKFMSLIKDEICLNSLAFSLLDTFETLNEFLLLLKEFSA